MEFFLPMAIPVLVMALIQRAFCSCRHIAVKLIPIGIPGALSLWYSVKEGQRTDPVCGMGAPIMGMLLTALLAGIALGWIMYGIKVLYRSDDEDKRR